MTFWWSTITIRNIFLISSLKLISISMRCFQLWKRLQSNWKLSESGISGTILDLEMLLPYNHYSMQNIVIHIITQNDTICAGGIAYLFYSGEITKAVTHEKVVNYLESHTSTLNSIYIPIVVSASQSKSQGHFTFFVMCVLALVIYTTEETRWHIFSCSHQLLNFTFYFVEYHCMDDAYLSRCWGYGSI